MSLNNSITFNLNGKNIQLCEGEFNPAQSLAEFLRSDSIHLMGTKISCREGGCGSCTVVMSTRSDAEGGKIEHKAVNSCMILLVQVHLTTITTIEFLGDLKNGIHPIQDSFVRHNATQCGYCTPGFIMATYAIFLNKMNQGNKKDGDDFDIEDLSKLDGNLCRCTGYRPIVEAIKDFMSKGKAKTSDDSISTDKTNLKIHDELESRIPEVPIEFSLNKFAKENKSVCIRYLKNNSIFFIPANLNEFVRIKKENQESKIIVGSSEISIDLSKGNSIIPSEKPQVFITTLHLNELSHVSLCDNDEVFKVGANTPLNDVISFIKEQLSLNKVTKKKEARRFFNEFKKRLDNFASNQVRNVASIVGNIAHGGAATDLSNFLLAMKAILIIKNVETGETTQREMNNSFYLSYRKTSLQKCEIITEILIKIPSKNEFVSTFKQGHRREDDICIVSSTVFANVDDKSNTVNDVRIAFSGLAACPCRATPAEDFLRGKEFSLENINESFKLIETQFPLDEKTPGGFPEFRATVAKSFLFRFFHQTQRDRNLPYDESAVNMIENPVDGESKSSFNIEIGGCHCKKNKKKGEVGFPEHHITAAQQTTGEAIFVDDLSPTLNTLHAYYVMSSVPHGRIKSIDFSEALKVPGVVDKITKEDVTGVNFSGDIYKHEPVFAADEVYCVGQPIALIVAKTHEIAKEAAKLVRVEYEELPAVLSIKQAIEAESYFPYGRKITDGNVDEAFSSCQHVIEGEMSAKGQSHFYFETCTALIVPSEDNNFTVYTSTQNPSMIQNEIAKVLGIHSNKIKVVVKRIGGGFGGKESRPACLSNAVSVAAFKLRCPVKMKLERCDDMALIGQRHPIYSKYKVGFNNDGKIEAIQFDHFLDCGWSLDMSYGVSDRALLHSDASYKIPNFLARSFLCRTNMISCTAFRGFGTPQGILAMECAIENVSKFLNKNPEEVKFINLYKPNDMTPYHLPIEDCRVIECFKAVEESFNLKKERENQKKFNQENKYKKIGISITPLVYGVSFVQSFLNQGNANVNIYNDGSVKIFHGGCEMGQGINTKIAQVAATVLDIPLKYIEVSAMTTDHVPNSSPTSASSGADLNGGAVKNACETIKERIEKYRSSDKTWEKACFDAYNDRVDLAAHGFTCYADVAFDFEKCRGKPFKYFAYGCSASEVEIDLLTGDHQVLKSNLVLDVGQSLNEGIDIGQIEGGLLQGIGWLTLEDVIRGDNEEHKWIKGGRILTTGPGFYKIPAIGDMPHEMKIELLNNGRNPVGLFSSKACSESPFCLAVSTGMAIVDAIRAARKEENLDGENYVIHFPMTAPRIRNSVSPDL